MKKIIFKRTRKMQGVDNFSRTVYTLIGDENYNDALKILESELHTFPESTAIHSLIAYCYYQKDEFQKACQSYAKLVQLNPTNDQYKLLHAQCLYKTEQYYDAMRVSFGVQSPDLKSKTSILQAAIRYAENDIQSYVNPTMWNLVLKTDFFDVYRYVKKSN